MPNTNKTVANFPKRRLIAKARKLKLKTTKRRRMPRVNMLFKDIADDHMAQQRNTKE